MYRDRRLQNGKREFPIVKDTTPNMMNPRLYTTSYNKPQGQQFDDTAVLSLFARHGRALTGVSPEHAQVVGNV